MLRQALIVLFAGLSALPLQSCMPLRNLGSMNEDSPSTTANDVESIRKAVTRHLETGAALDPVVGSFTHAPTFGYEIEGFSPRILEYYVLPVDNLLRFVKDTLDEAMGALYLRWILGEVAKLGPTLSHPKIADKSWNLDKVIKASESSSNLSRQALVDFFGAHMIWNGDSFFEYLPLDLKTKIFHRYPVKIWFRDNRAAYQAKKEGLAQAGRDELITLLPEKQPQRCQDLARQGDSDGELTCLRHWAKSWYQDVFRTPIYYRYLKLTSSAGLQHRPVLGSDIGGVWEIQSEVFSSFSAMEQHLTGFLTGMGSGTQDLVPQSVHMTVLLASEDLGFQSPNSAARIEARLSFLEFFKNMEGFSIVHSLKEQGVATGYAVHKTDLDPVAESITKDRKLVTKHVSIIAAQEDAFLAESSGDSASGYDAVTYPHLRIEVRNALSTFVRQTMACALLSYGLSRGWERFAYKGARALKRLSDQDFADLVSGRRYDATIQSLAPILGLREPFLNWAAFYGLEEPSQSKVNTASRRYFTAIVKPAAQGGASDGEQAAAAKRWATESELLEPATEALFWPKKPREAQPTP